MTTDSVQHKIYPETLTIPLVVHGVAGCLTAHMQGREQPCSPFSHSTILKLGLFLLLLMCCVLQATWSTIFQAILLAPPPISLQECCDDTHATTSLHRFPEWTWVTGLVRLARLRVSHLLGPRNFNYFKIFPLENCQRKQTLICCECTADLQINFWSVYPAQTFLDLISELRSPKLHSWEMVSMQ